VDGFLLLSAWPIIFEWIEKLLQYKSQGQITGFIMLIGHIFGIAVLVAMGELISLAAYSLVFLAVIAFIGFGLTFGIPKKV
jgi:hypothetical protein